MSNSPLVQTAIDAANDPRVAFVVSGSAIGGGIAARMELIQSVVGTLSVCIGFVTATVVCAIQIIKLIRYWRSLGIEP